MTVSTGSATATATNSTNQHLHYILHRSSWCHIGNREPPLHPTMDAIHELRKIARTVRNCGSHEIFQTVSQILMNELLLAPSEYWNNGLFSFPHDLILFSFTCGSNEFHQKTIKWQEILEIK